ncbi:MAG: hypothetical protein ACLU9S_23960 [Oscillospiraceae bacterium]
MFPQERLLLQSMLSRWNYLCPDYPSRMRTPFPPCWRGIRIVDYALRPP